MVMEPKKFRRIAPLQIVQQRKLVEGLSNKKNNYRVKYIAWHRTQTIIAKLNTQQGWG